MVKKDSELKKISKLLKSKIKQKRILTPSTRMIIKIKEHKPAEYVPIYFKNEIEEARKSMFFS